jgi:hypothetical protein
LVAERLTYNFKCQNLRKFCPIQSNQIKVRDQFKIQEVRKFFPNSSIDEAVLGSFLERLSSKD